jgi:aconitate hydratase 2/2-methylisocitrate dehydratase
VVGTGSSRKSATNSVLWHMGDEIPYIPNKKEGGFCFGGKIAPIFFNTLEDSGAFPIELDVSKMEMGQRLSLSLITEKFLMLQAMKLSLLLNLKLMFFLMR